MLERDTRRQTDHVGSTYGDCASYSGNVPYDGRGVIPGSIVFRIGCTTTSTTYFEGRPDVTGNINWLRKSSGKPAKIRGWLYKNGHFSINFDGATPEAGEEITVSYDWRPHYLHGAEVMVRLNNEERSVPIKDLQDALNSYLGD